MGRIEKCGGEELKNAFDMIHEEGYSLCYKFFFREAESGVELMYENHFRASNKTFGLPADRLGEASAIWPIRAANYTQEPFARMVSRSTITHRG